MQVGRHLAPPFSPRLVAAIEGRWSPDSASVTEWRQSRGQSSSKGLRGCHHKRPNTQNKLMQGKRAPLPCGNGNACYFLEPNMKHKCNSHRLKRHARATTRQEEFGSYGQFARRSSGMPNWTLEFTCGHATGLGFSRTWLAQGTLITNLAHNKDKLYARCNGICQHLLSPRSRTLLGGTCVATSTFFHGFRATCCS